MAGIKKYFINNLITKFIVIYFFGAKADVVIMTADEEMSVFMLFVLVSKLYHANDYVNLFLKLVGI